MSHDTGKDLSGSQLAQFYVNKKVLLTGGSGFLGQLIVQKLLRSCPDVAGIYLVLRQKKNLDAEERLDKILDNPVFNPLRKEIPDFRKKLHAISGDLQHDQLGFNNDDREFLINEIDIVMHSAATVDFNEPIRTAVNINVKGTRELVELCEEMKKLQVAMITSTAFAFCPKKTIKEYFSDPPLSPDTIIKMVEELDEKTLNTITPGLIGKWPNTYTFTKAIMEDVVKQKRDKLPLGLYRPSIVMPTYKDPLESWTDNMNGAVGMAVGAISGIIHAIKCSTTTKLQIVPADYVVNGFLAATYDVYKKYQITKSPENIIYNYVAPENALLDQDEYTAWGYKYLAPVSSPIWTLSLVRSSCPVIIWLATIFLHFIPGFFLDTVARIRGEKPRLIKIYKSWVQGNERLYYFLSTSWKMENDNIQKLWKTLNDKDKQIFPFNMDNFEWENYFKKYTWGLKEYILKEKMDKESIEKAYKQQKRFQNYHKIFLIVSYSLCVYILWKILSFVLY